MYIKCKPRLTGTAFSLAIIFAIGTTINVYGQNHLPAIKASSLTVDIRDGSHLQKAVWHLSPTVKPDVYFALEPSKNNTITFFTDQDSISFYTSPGKDYDFLIILNQKDTCYTRISTNGSTGNKNSFSDTLLPVDKLKSDFGLMRRSLESIHPGLYRYRSKKEMDHLFDSCSRQLGAPMPKLDFAKYISYIVSAIEDGHTGPGQTKLLLDAYSDKPLFPITVYFAGGKCYALCSGYPDILPGTEITAINGTPVGEIKERMFKYLPSDGMIGTKKQQILNNGAFPFLYRWLYGGQVSFRVTHKATGQKKADSNVMARVLTDDEDCANINNWYSPSILSLEFMPGSNAVLVIRAFDDHKFGNVDFKEFLDSAFIKMKAAGTKTLIIDVRGNSGGRDEYGALLYSYLASKPFRYFRSIRTTQRAVLPAEDPLLSIQQPAKNCFAGKVYVLINGASFSTTADFCAIVKSHKRGIFIGEETGGAYEGNTSGQTPKVELPNSGIVLFIPMFKYTNMVMPAKLRGRGTIPDYKITPGVNDLLSHKDVALEFARALATTNLQGTK